MRGIGGLPGWAGMLVVVLVMLSCPVLAGADTGWGGEFADPSPNGPPPVSPYNTTPSCPLNSADYYQCDVPSSELPPADPSNLERYLNSAYWPAEKRPDIEMYAIQQFGYDYQNCSALLPHYCFLVDAQAVGYPVTHTPQVGDLWLAPCSALIWEGGLSANCAGNNGWYMGYVDQVNPDGSFIESGGGADPSTDSGLAEAWMSGAMDANTDFIGFFPPGQSPLVQVDVYDAGGVDGNGEQGAGTVTDSQGQTCHMIGATQDCEFREPEGVPITFTANPDTGSSFGGFSFCTTGPGTTCAYTFTSAINMLAAEFEPNQSATSSTTDTSDTPTTSEVRKALRAALTPPFSQTTIASLLSHGGVAVSFDAPAAGSLVIEWYYTPRTITRKHEHRGTRRRVVAAQASVRVPHAGRTEVRIKLTAKGRTLLKHAKRQTLTAMARFTAPGTAPIRMTRHLTLTRPPRHHR